MNTLFRFSKPLLQGVSVCSWPFSTFLISGSVVRNKVGSSHRIGVARQLDLHIALTRCTLLVQTDIRGFRRRHFVACLDRLLCLGLQIKVPSQNAAFLVQIRN